MFLPTCHVYLSRLRGDLAGLAAYVQRAKKQLRDEIQLKVAADLKLCRDIKKFGRFIIQGWQMEVLPFGTHACRCTEYATTKRVRSRPAYQYRTLTPQVSGDEALPEVDIKEEQNDGAMEDEFMAELL